MKATILRGKFSKKLFGVKVDFRHYTIQLAYGKLGVYNSKTYTWSELWK